ncbi:hypothetical protein B0H16DRAFT_1705024 [Mycena metata]|uniref:F-box domain-containing protein n=1 Tax=Mycena metata TaxID=1033252 RepID=A0AAD7E2D5_9AGAR|nr:hypothetical protein B0H16DRAFT_1705024 [Mycena metata]
MTACTQCAVFLVTSSLAAHVGGSAAISASYALSGGNNQYSTAIGSPTFFGALSSVPTNWSYQFFAGLPTELLIEVFSHACGTYHGARRAFVRTRSAIALTPHRLVSDVRRWTSHWTTGVLDIKLKCDTLYSLLYSVSSASAPRMFPSRTIAVLAPFFSRCSRLCLVLEDRTALPEVLQRLRRTRTDLLETFSLSRVTLPFAMGQVLPIVFKPRRLFAGSDFPALRHVSIVNATVGWFDLRFYAGLDDLIFICLLYPVNPTTLRLYYILDRARRLLRLCLQRIQCEDLLDLGLPPLSLPLLRVLELDLDGSVGVSCIFAVCSMPALTSLSVCLGGDEDVTLLLGCAHSMGTITSLTINGTAQDTALITALYAVFPRVLSLDLSRATPAYFRALYDPTRRLPHMFMGLEELSVIDVSLVDLKLMLERRTTAPHLRRLTAHRASERDSFDALLWCLANFTEEQFTVDPDPSFNLRWFDDA